MSEPLVRNFGSSSGRHFGRLQPKADIFGAVLGCLRRIPVWVARYRQRKALAELSDHLLSDIGVSRKEATREAAKPFWR